MPRLDPTLIGFFFALALVSPLANAESRGTYYVFQMDPQGGEVLDDSGWGLGAKVAIPLVSTRERIKLTAGFDMGTLESTIGNVTQPTGVGTTQDYQRIFAGADVGRKLDARIRPHLGVHLVLLRQDEKTLFIDPSTGELYGGFSDSSTRLAYDLSAGLGLGITAKTGLDAGARYMNGFRLTVADTDGSVRRTRPDYIQFYFGVTHRFAWPEQ